MRRKRKKCTKFPPAMESCHGNCSHRAQEGMPGIEEEMEYESEIKIDEEERRRYEEMRRRRRQRARRRWRIRTAVIVGVPLVMLLLVLTIPRLIRGRIGQEEVLMPYDLKYVAQAPDYQVELLERNEYSRPGDALVEVKGIVVHYTANPGTSAEQNRSYFQNLKDTGETYASSHFVIGMEGEIIQCIPCNEIAYATKERNVDTISIECCIPDETGEFSDETYESLVALTTWLMGRYDLTTADVIRHYDVTGKLCPKYYVENGDAWMQFKMDLLTYIDANGIAKTEEIK